MGAATHSPITVVSGLPRSGTSMMMQMLEAGGMPVLTDGARSFDEDNQRGYYEFEPVKGLRRDASWLARAPGKAVKIIYMLVKELPAEYDYRVLFMCRDLSEVVRSQQAMLQRNGNPGAALGPEEMARVFERQLEAFDQWIDRQSNFRRLSIDYRQVIAEPRVLCQKVVEFLDVQLDVEAMAAVVEPALYRQRSG